MTPDRPVAPWNQVRALFGAASALPPQEREALLSGLGHDAAVVAEVRSLLRHADATSFLDAPAAGEAAPRSVHAGLQLGPWRLLAPLGEGGMGEVWRAERADGSYEAQAAVKLLRAGMDSAAVLSRFALERQALARLNHPHIARLLDAGRGPEGDPYFVMELVEGQAIDRACQGLPLRERLTLFLQLADAVSHAHRNLLVHRDLKPGNVMVTADGQVKLLDFGIAKALEPDRPDATQAGPRPYTPHYASPEQVRGEPVSTATDIYSLGVLLYVMLTGVRPYGRNATTPLEAARSVLEEEPTRPSALSPALVGGTQGLPLRRRLKGDLDNILLKALAKPIQERYASVDALADDVRAYLAGYPVSAQAPRKTYLLRKFIARNRVATAAALVAGMAVVGGAALALWQAHVAQQQRVLAERRFDEVRAFARTMLFDVDNALRDGPTAGREKLVATTLQYLDRLSSERTADAVLLREVAEAYERVGDIQGNSMLSNLGRPQDARRSQDKALALRETVAQLAPGDFVNLAGLVSTHGRLGDLARSAGKLPDAERHYSRAVELGARLVRAKPDDMNVQLRQLEARRYLASVWYWPFHDSLGRYAQGRAEVEAVERGLAALAARHPGEAEVLAQHSSALNQLTEFQRIAGEFPATLATQRRSNEVAARLLALAPSNPRWQRWMALAEGYLADALLATGDIEAGVRQWEASIARREAMARADPKDERVQRNLANGYGPLAEALDALGRRPEALAWYAKENALLQRQRGLHPEVKALGPRLDESDRDLALQLALNGRVAEAVSRQRALDARRGNEVQAAPTDADAARFALSRAQVLNAAGAGTSAQERQQALELAAAGLDVLRKAAAAEPANALLAREAALGAHTLAVAGADRDAAAACDWLREAVTGLDALAAAKRLPATVVAQPADARARWAACPRG